MKREGEEGEIKKETELRRREGGNNRMAVSGVDKALSENKR